MIGNKLHSINLISMPRGQITNIVLGKSMMEVNGRGN